MCRGLEKSCTECYSFGFNGKENDKEWGNQLIQDYGFRLYNPAIGKFLSVDPLAPDYPELTTYQFASNSPISGVDLDGLEYLYAADGTYIGLLDENPKLKNLVAVKIKGEVKFLTNGSGERMTHDEFIDRNHYTYGEGGGWLPRYYAQSLKYRMKGKKKEYYRSRDKFTKFGNSEGHNGNYADFKENYVDNDFDLSKISNENGKRNRIQANTKANLLQNIEGGKSREGHFFHGHRLSNWRGASLNDLDKWLSSAREKHNVEEFGGTVYLFKVHKGNGNGVRYHIFFRQEFTHKDKRHSSGLPEVKIYDVNYPKGNVSTSTIPENTSHDNYIEQEKKDRG